MNDTATLDPTKIAADFSNEEATTMIVLNERIPLLWTAHRESKLEAKRTKEELARVRQDLSQHLHQMKELLSRPGRSGLWASFLRGKKIPRATADRLVLKFEASLQDGKNKCLNEAFDEPDHVKIFRLVQRILPQLLKTLTTKQAIFMFISTVLDKLPEAEFNVEDRYLEVFGFDETQPPVHP